MGYNEDFEVSKIGDAWHIRIPQLRRTVISVGYSYAEAMAAAQAVLERAQHEERAALLQQRVGFGSRNQGFWKTG